jgi:hypothetical protein
LALGQEWNALTTGAQDSVDSAPCESQTAGSPDRSVTFKAPLAGTYAFAVINANFDTVIHVRLGDCGGRVLACNDDADDTRLVSQVVLNLTAHQTVVVVVDGFAGATGSFDLRIDRIETTCDNGIDDDGDGDVDCDDSDCDDLCVVEDTWPTAWIAYEHALLLATNAVRVRGATCGDTYYPPVLPLTVSTRVREAARGHALEMAEHDYFDHLGRDGSTFDVRMTRAGYAGRPPRSRPSPRSWTAPSTAATSCTRTFGWSASATPTPTRAALATWSPRTSAAATDRPRWVRTGAPTLASLGASGVDPPP